MKKLLSLLISLTLIVSVFCNIDFSAYAISSKGKCGDNVTYTYNSFSGTLNISGTGAMYKYSGSALTQNPFYNQTGIKSVVVNNGITGLGDYAFYGCSGIKSVSMPSSLTGIDYSAFYGCTGLTSVTIPNSVTSIGLYAFYGCSGLTSITISGNVKSIGPFAFSKCTGLTSITIPGSVNYISGSAFSGCSSLARIEVSGDNSSYISSSGVLFDKNKTTIVKYPSKKSGNEFTIPNSVKSIDTYAFDNCTFLTSITIPKSVTSMGASAFQGCTGLKSIAIPNSISSIPSYAFSSCAGLTGVTIPVGVTKIEANAFAKCTGLKNITIPSGVTSLEAYVFSGCTGLKGITIPNSVKSIGSYAFNDCAGLTGITIPGSVTSIDTYAFYNCTGLTGLTIPSSVNSIGNSAFLGCTGLKSVNIPNSVKSLGPFTFYGCTGLKSITVPNSISSIPSYAFYGCTALQSVTIPINITSIGNSAFSKCENIKYVFYGGNIYEWNSVIVNEANNELKGAIFHYNSNGDHNWGTAKTTKATLSKNGKKVWYCSVCKVAKEKTVYCPKTIKLSTTSYECNGKERKPSVSVTDSNGSKISSSNYTVSYSGSRKDAGIYDVTVKFKGDYSGTKKLSFKINPKKSELSKVVSYKKSFGVRWNAVSGVSGYQMQISTNSKFTSGTKTYTFESSVKSAMVKNGIKSKTKYYVHIRTYKTVKHNGKSVKVYSAWSKTKSVTTK